MIFRQFIRKMSHHFDYLVIGGGSGGIASARRAREFGNPSVCLIENSRLGGTCVNVGCVPKKIMYTAASLAEDFQIMPSYGFDAEKPPVYNWQRLKESRDAYVLRLNGIYANMLDKSGVKYVKGSAKFVSSHEVDVDGVKYSGKHVLIAIGGRPSKLGVPGEEYVINSDGFFDLEELPKKCCVVGAGYIAVELAGVLSALGSEVTLVIRHDRVLRTFDNTISSLLTEFLVENGIKLVKHSGIQSVEKTDDGLFTVNSKTGPITGQNVVLQAIGRVPNTDLTNVAATGADMDKGGHIIVDEFQNTSVKNLYAVGDVGGKFLLTPVAIKAGRKLAHRLFNGETNARCDYSCVPTVVFSHPPIGTCGLTEDEAKKKYGEENIKVYGSTYTPMHYAVCTHKQRAANKLIVTLPDEKVVGLHLIGISSDEIMQGFAVAMSMGATKKQFDETIAIHPTVGEDLVTMR